MLSLLYALICIFFPDWSFGYQIKIKTVLNLVAGGKTKLRLRFARSTISLIARFWISVAAISFRQLSSEKQMIYYLSLIAKLLSPYASAKAKKQIRLFFEKWGMVCRYSLAGVSSCLFLSAMHCIQITDYILFLL